MGAPMSGTRDRNCLFQALLDETLSHPDGGTVPHQPVLPGAPAPEPERPPAVQYDGRPTVDRRRVPRFGDLASRYDRSGTAV